MIIFSVFCLCACVAILSTIFLDIIGKVTIHKLSESVQNKLIGVITLTQFILIIHKICNAITCSWWIVLMPIIVIVILLVLLMAISLIVEWTKGE